MAYYLIDFENVKSRGMEGVELLAEEDTVCIFYSDNADSMTFDLHRKLNETKAQIIYHKVAVGTKNALDFQLATYLGYLICEQQREGIHPDYFIVTKDNGFTSLMVYWKAQGVPVRITRNLLWGKNPTAEQNPAAEENAEEITGSVERESVQNLPLEEAEPMAVEITEQETENATAVMTEEPKAEVDAEEIAEPAFVSVQILEEPLPEILEPVPVEPVKKTVRKKSGNTRKKNTANMTEKKTTEKTVDKKASEKKAAEEPELIEILHACTNIRDQLLILLLAETGFRIGEILGVDYTRDIDYESHTVSVYFRDDNENDARAKNAEERRAVISSDTFKFLLHYLSKYRNLLQHQTQIFINIAGDSAGRPMKVESVYDMLDRMQRKTGIKVTPHMLRRYYARTRWNDGWALELISQALGHKHLDTTIKYLDVLDDKLMEASREFYAKHSNTYGIRKLL